MKQNKNKNPFRSNSSLIFYFLKGNVMYFILGILSLTLVSVLELLNPKIIAFTVDSVIGDKEADIPSWLFGYYETAGGRDFFRSNVYVIALAIIAIAFLSVLFRYFYRVLNTKGAEGFVEKIRNTLFGHFEHLPFSVLNESQTGDLIQRSTSDVDTVKRFVADQLVSVFRIAILLALSVTFMYSMNPTLTFIAGAFIPVIILYSVIFRHFIEKNFRKCDEEESVLSTILQENLTGVRVVRAFGRERYELDRFGKQNNSFRNDWVKLANLMSFFWNFGDLFSTLQALTVIIVGTVLCVKGSLTEGELIAFISYNSMLIWPVRQLGRTISEMSKAGVSISRIRDILKTETENEPKEPEYPSLNSDIVFENVGFSYVEDGAEVLKDISFTIKKGQTVGILGGTGSGKSTLMYLLARLYDPTEGRITVGGVPLENIPRQYVRSNVGIVLQEPFLFSRKLGENITITKDSITDEELSEAIKTASLDETIEKLTSGLETVVGERGVTLSGGQKQRTAIARMITGKPPVMIFDDSLSAVDTETDVKIRDALKEKCKGSTVVLISHRITTLMDADFIIVLDKGRIVESGTHSELLSIDGGIYNRIYSIQNRNIEEVSD